MIDKCVLLDMNGTIRNDLHVVYRSMSEVFERFGKRPPALDEYRRTHNVHYWDLYRKHGFLDSEKPAADAIFSDLFFRKYAHLARPFPDAVGTVLEISARGIPVGIVSNLERNVLGMYMEQYGLSGFVSVSVCREDVGEVKPSPASILFAFEKLGIPPEHGSYTGDQSQDVIAAHAARTTAIAVSRRGSYHTRRMLEEAKPDIIITRLSDLLLVDRSA
ncbi:MAG: HAD hydrolase-like protein [Candidatus Aenigmarchaeota archaeon]|nr:HAD hydrolase-like protein [Candidatus Aenigmarchaeota archaeon]